MIAGVVVVAEVVSDGDVIIYDPAMFNADEAASYMAVYALMEDRHFFTATIALKEAPVT